MYDQSEGEGGFTGKLYRFLLPAKIPRTEAASLVIILRKHEGKRELDIMLSCFLLLRSFF